MSSRFSQLVGLHVLMFAASSLQAGSVNTCTAPGFSITVVDSPCTFPDLPFPPGSFLPGDPRNKIPPSPGVVTAYSTVSLSGNELKMQGIAFVKMFPYNTIGPFPQVFHGVWNDSYTLPAADPNDIYKVTEIIGGLANTGTLSVGSLVDTTVCDIHYFGNPACTVKGTLQASTVTGAVDSGDFKFTFSQSADSPGGPGGIANQEDFETLLTLDRFRPDGVTPDPFTETAEPASYALLVFGLGLLTFAVRRGDRPFTLGSRATNVSDIGGSILAGLADTSSSRS